MYDPTLMMGAPYCARIPCRNRSRRLSKTLNGFSFVCSIFGLTTCCLLSVVTVVMVIALVFATGVAVI